MSTASAARCGSAGRRVAIMPMPDDREAGRRRPIPRRGRIWVDPRPRARRSAALGYAIVDIATQKAGPRRRPRRRHRRTRRRSSAACRRKATGSAPPTRRSRSRSSTTCSARSCREDFLGTIPALVNDYARPGDVKLLYRHYSVSRKPAGARLLRRRGGGASRATAGSTPTSSSATRTRPNASASTRTSSTRWPARSRN